jgi:hypothetical protein
MAAPKGDLAALNLHQAYKQKAIQEPRRSGTAGSICFGIRKAPEARGDYVKSLQPDA